MIKFNEQKKINITDSMLSPLGYNEDERKQMQNANVTRSVDSDNNCSFSMNVGNRGEWSLHVAGTLPEDTIDTVFSKLLSVTLDSIRGTMGTVANPVTTNVPVDENGDME